MADILERKAYDTRPLVYNLVNPDVPQALTGATVTITIVDPGGVVVRRNAPCEVTNVATGEVTYRPTSDDFATPGTYQIQWLATYEGGSTARWPYDSQSQAKIHPTVANSGPVPNYVFLDNGDLVTTDDFAPVTVE